MMHVMMVLTGKMKTDKNFLYPKRFCERVCQSWAIAPIRWRGDHGEGGFNNVSDVNDDDVVSSRSCQHGVVARHVRAVEERAAGWDPSGGPKNRVQSADQVPRAGRKDLYAICNILFQFFSNKVIFYFFLFFLCGVVVTTLLLLPFFDASLRFCAISPSGYVQSVFTETETGL